MKVYVDGEPVAVRSGQTVAAVLLGLGRTAWRTTRVGGRPRGLFCGIGVCFDCLVVVNGLPDVRACQRLVADGDVIRLQHGAELPAESGPGSAPSPVAGPAGEAGSASGSEPPAVAERPEVGR